MRKLHQIELHNVSGKGRLTHSIQATTCTVIGLSMGAFIGSQCTHFFINTEQKSLGYATQIQNYLIDSLITYNMGAYGINNQASLIGCIGGSLIGSVTASALFGFFI